MDESFSNPRSEVDAEAGGGDATHRRATRRDSMFLHATLRRNGDGPPLTMRIRNLSAGGMMAEIGEPFTKGDRISIDLRGIGMLEGIVAWREESRIGVAFAQEIDPRLARKSVAVRPASTPAPAPLRTVRRPRLFGE